MEDFVIVTDSSADLPSSYLKEHGVVLMSLSYTYDGEHFYSNDEESAKTFYDKVRSGSMPTTSQVNPDEAAKVINSALEISKNVLCLSFSSGLSGTYNSTRIAAEMISDERDDVNIVVIDTLAASMGQGLVVYKAVCMKEAGKSMEEIAQWVMDNRDHIVHIVTVSDLFHLYRGGRVKKTAAVVGTMINLKPIINVDNEGHLNNIKNARGRKKALTMLVDYMEEHMGSFKDSNDMVFISHSDAEEDAQSVADAIKERFGLTNFMINPIGPVIGSHTGPDTIALFFMGETK